MHGETVKLNHCPFARQLVRFAFKFY